MPADETLLACLRRKGAQAQFVTSACTGALLEERSEVRRMIEAERAFAARPIASRQLEPKVK